MNKTIIAILLLAVILMVSGCTTRQSVGYAEFDEPNDWNCKADCINWCKNKDSEIVEYTFNEQTNLCTCTCFIE